MVRIKSWVGFRFIVRVALPSGFYLSSFTTELLWICWHLAGSPRFLSYSGAGFFFFRLMAVDIKA